MKSAVFVAFIACSASLAEANFEDNRCRCICPSTEYFNTKVNISASASAEKGKGEQSKRYYTMTNINPLSCNTQTVVKGTARSLVDEQRLDAFLANCNCRFESRNSVLLKVVVIFVICTLFGLTSYMAYLMVVDPMMRRRGQFVTYRRQENDVGGGFDGGGVNTFWFANESWDPASRSHHGRHHHRLFNDSSTSGSDEDHRESEEEDEEENDHTIEENIFSRSGASVPLPPAPRGSVSSEESEDQSHGDAHLNGGRQQPMGTLSISPAAHMRSRSGMGAGVLDRVDDEEQAKWQNEVEEQRRKVMIEHSILN